MSARWPLGMITLVGCGGAVAGAPDSGGASHVSGGAGSLVADAASPVEASPGVGPIDASGQPTALVMACDGMTTAVSVKLPCLLGHNLSGTDAPGYHLLECQISGAPDTISPTDVAISMIVPLVNLPMMLGQPVSLPFEGIPPPPGPGSGQIAGYPGEGFVGTLTGAAVFSQVDPVGRAFVGQIQQAHVTWSGDRGDSLSCSVVDGPFWAVPGGFY